MNGTGKEYALAMFSIALESDSLEVIHDDFVEIKKAITETPEYLEFLLNPALPKSERLENIKMAFEGRVCDDVFAFLNIMVDHGDLYFLPSCIDDFETMYEDFKHYARAVVTSVVELSDEQKNKLISKLRSVTGKTVIAEYVIDKNLIGGMTVIVDGKYYDGSVRKNLNNIKEEIS